MPTRLLDLVRFSPVFLPTVEGSPLKMSTAAILSLTLSYLYQREKGNCGKPAPIRSAICREHGGLVV